MSPTTRFAPRYMANDICAARAVRRHAVVTAATAAPPSPVKLLLKVESAISVHCRHRPRPAQRCRAAMVCHVCATPAASLQQRTMASVTATAAAPIPPATACHTKGRRPHRTPQPLSTASKRHAAAHQCDVHCIAAVAHTTASTVPPLPPPPQQPRRRCRSRWPPHRKQ